MLKRIFKVLKTISLKYCLTFFFCFFFQINIKADQQEYQFKQIKIEDGLSQSTIYCMMQDSKGYLWFGTANGLNRYDGYNFKIFSNITDDSTSISDNSILSIYEDKDGFIWIGTVEGVLNKFDRRKGTFQRFYITDTLKVNLQLNQKYFDFPLPLSRNSDKSITAIAEGSNNILWIGTWGSGLISFNKLTKEAKHFYNNPRVQNGFSSNQVKTIIADNENVWVGTIGSGLYKIDTNNAQFTFTHYKNIPGNSKSLSNDRVVSLFKDKNGDLWIGTYGGGLNLLSKNFQLLPNNKVEFIKYFHFPNKSNSISSNIITSIIQDMYGSIWIGTFGGGLDKFDPKKNLFVNFKNDPKSSTSISKNDVLSLLEDASGSIWIGSHLGKGLNKLERIKEKFKQINRDVNNVRGLNDDVVWAFTEDNNSNLWIGTYNGGLNKWDRVKNTFSYYTPNSRNPSSINDHHIRSLLFDERGFIWIGTYSGGLNIYNISSNSFTRYLNNPNDSTSIGANQVQAIFIDSEKNTWIGTFGGGLNKISPFNKLPSKISFKRYKNNPIDPFSLSDNRVYSIYEDKEGIIWIGTFGGGLNKFDKRSERFISYRNIVGDESSLSDNRVMSVYEDSNGSMWVSTYGGGLLQFDKRKEKFIRYSHNQRLNSSAVYGVLEDKNGNLWMSSDNGLFKYSLKLNQFTRYDLNDGLQSLEFSGGAFFKSKSGYMYFGGINGFNYFHPDSIKDNYYVPPVVISSIRIFNEPVKGEVDSIFVSYDQNFISIEFSALDFTNPSDNQYAYNLDGLDNDWNYVDSRRRIANFTNLPPGKYVFRVRGSNSDGVWNNVGAELHIFISPPYWQTWWFLSIVVIFIAGIIYYFSTIRYRNLLAIEKLKSKLSADLHDNIGSGLTEISILSDLAANDIKSSSVESVHRLAVISDKARTLIDNMSDIVWMVNPHRDSLFHVILRLKDSYSDFLNSMSISFETVNLEKFSSIKLPMEYKQNLFLIFKEAINNSIKHSNCKKITLEASLEKDLLELKMKDDGVGIDLDKIKYGNGILNMKSRAKIINGQLEIEGNKEGTIVKFRGKISGIKKIGFFLKK